MRLTVAGAVTMVVVVVVVMVAVEGLLSAEGLSTCASARPRECHDARQFRQAVLFSLSDQLSDLRGLRGDEVDVDVVVVVVTFLHLNPSRRPSPKQPQSLPIGDRGRSLAGVNWRLVLQVGKLSVPGGVSRAPRGQTGPSQLKPSAKNLD